MPDALPDSTPESAPDAPPEAGRPRDRQDSELIRMIRQEKAEAAVRAISAGSNPVAEAFALANDFTDGMTDSIGKRIRRWLRR